MAAAAFWLAYNNYRHDIARAHERIGSGSRIAQTPCGPIEYAIAGDGPPVLVVHGAGGGFDQGVYFGQGLVDRGFLVIAMSRYGYLRTPLPQDASAAAQADAHACLLDALNVQRAAIVGASAGAPSAIQFALRHAQRCTALVLLVPAVFVPRAGAAPPMKTPEGTKLLFDTALKWDFLFWAATKIARASVIRSLLATPPDLVDSANADEQTRVSQMLDRILPVSARRTGLLNDAAVVASLLRYPLERIRTPTLAISTVDDLFGTYDSARYTAQNIPGARFVGYPTGGHIWVGRQKDVMSEIATFLKERYS